MYLDPKILGMHWLFKRNVAVYHGLVKLLRGFKGPTKDWRRIIPLHELG